MKREWKPGDVAMVTYDLYGDGEHMCSDPRILRSDGKWYGSDGWVTNDDDLTIRPLVVIDPESGEQVERLIRLQDKHFNDGCERRVVNADDLRDMQAALREFANPTPPKPDEPTGLGAVVEAEGGLWVRFHSKTGWWWRDNAGATRRYADLAAVRVLSEGVSDD